MDTPIDEAYRAAVERSLADRIPSRVARAHGMPKDSIHTVLRGHAPNLVRADAICRALGFTFVLGASEAVGASSHAGPRVDRAPVGDVQLAEMISRLVDRWETRRYANARVWLWRSRRCSTSPARVRERRSGVRLSTSAGGCSRRASASLCLGPIEPPLSRQALGGLDVEIGPVRPDWVILRRQQIRRLEDAWS